MSGSGGFKHPHSGQRGIKAFFSSLRSQDLNNNNASQSARPSAVLPVSPTPPPSPVESHIVSQTDSDPDDDFLVEESDNLNATTAAGAGEGHEHEADNRAQDSDANHHDGDGAVASGRTDVESTRSSPLPPPPLPTNPYQPLSSIIPPYEDARRKHLFVKSWFKDYPWLHYEVGKGVLCLTCMRAERNSLVSTCIKKEAAFTTTGVVKWKDGKRRFSTHENSNYHKAAVHALLSLSNAPVTALISLAQAKQQADARVALKAIFSTLKLLARQGLAIRGKTMENSNLMQMLNLRAQDIPELDSWLKRRMTFLSPEVQNDMLEIMANEILRGVVADVKKCGKFSAIMDECRDTSNMEQVAICLRTVDMGTLQAAEYFIGLYATSSTTGQALTDIFLDVLKRLSLDVSNLSGQCFDGASNMKGEFKGVQARLKEMQPLALFVHCFNHSLNLALQDTMKGLPGAREALQWVHDVGVIVNRSPKRKHSLDELRVSYEEQTGPGPTAICPTRWTVRVRSITGLINSYQSVLTFLNNLAGEKNTMEIVENGKKINVPAKALGLHDQLEKPSVYFTLLAMRDLFTPCEGLSKTLQSPTYTVSGAKQAVDLTLQKLRRMRSDEHFETLWVEMQTAESKYTLKAPVLGRPRNPPSRNEYNPSHSRTNAPHQFQTAKDKMRMEYFQMVDQAISEINSRFDQDDFHKLELMENALLTPPNAWGADSEKIEQLLEKYGFNVRKLKCNLESLYDIAPGCKTVGEVAAKFSELHPQVRALFSEMEDLIVLLLVVPVSAATAERTFSMMRRLKTYLRSTMGQARLNHLALLTIYKERVDQLNISTLMKLFVNNDLRHSIFGSI